MSGIKGRSDYYTVECVRTAPRTRINIDKELEEWKDLRH
jgi:hypothetical protein